LLGVYGQSIFVDPELKLVMVMTAAAKNASVGKQSCAVERDASGARRSANTAAGNHWDRRSLPLYADARDAFLRAKDSACGHFGAGDFLDLAGGARSVIDQDALTQPEIDDVLLARHLLRRR
jgi:hypothetical protein